MHGCSTVHGIPGTPTPSPRYSNPPSPRYLIDSISKPRIKINKMVLKSSKEIGERICGRIFCVTKHRGLRTGACRTHAM